MTITKEPFRSYTLEEDKKSPYDTGKVFTIRLNAEEYRLLKEDMKLINCRNESTTVKFLMDIGRNVLHSNFSKQNIRWLSNPLRRKLEEI